MEETFETRDWKQPLKVCVTRSLCACGLMLSLSASAPLSALAADASNKVVEAPVPVLPAVTRGNAVEAPVPVLPTDAPSNAVEAPVPLLPADTPGDGTQVPALRSTIIQSDSNHPQPTVNPDDVREVAPGTELEMVLSKEIEAGENKQGDEFFGKIIKDALVGDQVVIPRGSVVHGVLSTVVEPKRAGRNGYITTRFDYLITPDGRKVPIEGNSTTRDSKSVAAAKVVGRAAGYTAVGGAVGTVMALQFGGLAAAAASHGAVLAGGAAVGGATGLTMAMLMRGQTVMLPPGTEMHVKLGEPLKLPTMTMPAETAEDFSIAGLKLKVAGMRINHNPFGEMTDIRLTLDILNQTQNTFSSFDIGLEDDLGNLFFSSPLGGVGIQDTIVGAGGHVVSTMTFSVYNAKIRHKLVFFKPYSREPLAKLALTEAMLLIGKESHKSKHADAETH